MYSGDTEHHSDLIASVVERFGSIEVAAELASACNDFELLDRRFADAIVQFGGDLREMARRMSE